MATVQTIIDQVRAQVETTSGRLTDAILFDWINDAVADLFDELLTEVPEYFDVATANVNLVAGTETYWPSASIAQLLGVDYLKDNNGTNPEYKTLTLVAFEERNELAGQRYPVETTSQGEPTHYAHRGSAAYIYPKPTENKTNGLRFHYIVEPTEYTDTTDALDDWLDDRRIYRFCVTFCCERHKMRDETQEDVQVFNTWKRDQLQRIVRRIKKFSKSGPRTVTMHRRKVFGQRRN